MTGAADSASVPLAGALELRDGRLWLTGLPRDACIAYWVDVRAALEFDALMLAYPGDESLLFGTELFLWRPPRRSAQLQSTVRFVLPPGVRVSTPWTSASSTPRLFSLDERAFAFTGHLVIGRFAQQDVVAPGAHLHVTLLPGFPSATVPALTDWLARSAVLASQPTGKFPVADAQVIIAPTSPSVSPIHFGHTGRSGGASIVLFMPTDVTADSLRDDWIAIHEFSHLYHPFIRREDAWLSEGIATYLQEVLRARVGLIGREQLWRRLFEGAALGRETTRTLAEDSRRMAFEPNYRRVYWAGAALVLMLDVELRKASGGELSLDVLLSRLQSRRQLFTHSWSARELLATLDELAGIPACQSVTSRYFADGSRLPDLTALYEQLGIDSDEAGVRFMSTPLAWVRDAIAPVDARPVAPSVLGGRASEPISN